MLRVRMVRFVHPDRCRVVIDRRIDDAPQRQLNARGRAAATGKAVNDDLAVKCLLCAQHHATPSAVKIT